MSLWIAAGRGGSIAILMMFGLPIHEREMSFCLFRPSLISVSNVLWFVSRCFTSSVKFIPVLNSSTVLNGSGESSPLVGASSSGKVVTCTLQYEVSCGVFMDTLYHVARLYRERLPCLTGFFTVEWLVPPGNYNY